MKITTIIASLAVSSAFSVTAATPVAKPEPPVQNTVHGSIERMRMYSPQLRDSVTIDVWLPEEYNTLPDKRFPVIYMHDGQNLYDASTTWNHQSWEIDDAMDNLISSDEIEPAIVVGIHSFPETRVADLMPQKAIKYSGLKETLEEVKLIEMNPRGDDYAKFMVNTLKPSVDSRFRTLSDARHTTVMGSSMGGLMSIYALCEYPDVFGNALCLSTHWIGTPEIADMFSGAMASYLEKSLPEAADRESPKAHRLYFDHGTATIDAHYGPYEEKMIELIRKKGYSEENGTLLTYVDEGAPHEESAWSARVNLPLLFLLHRQ